MTESEVIAEFNKACSLKAKSATLADDGWSWEVKTTCGRTAFAYEPGAWAGQTEFDFEMMD